ncbi:CaiB/BaiF CoA-transferase family protein [Reyranella sp. CPCC 100927]|uniref:CaiB/BaiF CoA transferase family protein n=1 Tax=Reyranella sp. CPCC 100927 TaxID=2599616 RepID=UPI002102E67C|nr:CoA transferase [Reyranella sp. CPCC 100927]
MTDDTALDDELPLAGVTVLDVSSFIAAPAAAVVLGDFGADVIKVEPPGTGDPHRNSWQNPNYPRTDVNFVWQLDGRNKRSVALDLKHPDGRAAFDRLVARADVMIVNFPLPVRDRLRLRFEDVAAVNPCLVYASLTGYGESGPDRDMPGFDVNAYFGRAGILDAQRYEDGPPGFSLPAQGDRCAAMTIVSAILLGLRRRDRTGKGGWVGTSLYANGVWSNGTLAQAALVGGFITPRPPRERPRNALANIYRTRDDRWVQLTLVREDKGWDRLCRALGRPDLATDTRFATREARRTHSVALAAILDDAFARHDWPHWRQVLRAHEVTFGVIERLQDLPDDPQAYHAGIIAETKSPDVPRTINNPVRLGFARPREAGAPPSVGEHTAQVLREAGLSDGEIATLRSRGATN